MQLITQLMRALNGNHIKAKKINIVRGKKVTIESESPMKWEAEGEIFSTEAKTLEFNKNKSLVGVDRRLRHEHHQYYFFFLMVSIILPICLEVVPQQPPRTSIPNFAISAISMANLSGFIG